MKRLTTLTIVLALSACSEITDFLTFGEPLPDGFGIGIHPVDLVADDVEKVCDAVGLIRMEAPANVTPIVAERITSAPDDCRFLIIVGEPVPLEFVAEFANDPRVDSWQVGNELNNCGENWPCWDPIETELWLRVWVPAVREAASERQTIVCPAATPLFSDSKAMAWYAQLADSGVLNLCDVQAAHLYGKPWTSPEKWVSLTDEVNLLKSVGLPVWITEYGTTDTSEEIEYATRLPALFEVRGVIPERWYWYSWNDPTLGFELRKSTPLWLEVSR